MGKRNEEMAVSLGGKTIYDDIFETNLKDRKIFLNQQIDETLVELVMTNIIKWNKEDKGLSEKDRKPIRLYINSVGGSVFEGLVLCDLIKESKTPVKAITLAYCYSMGGIIFASCNERYMFNNSSMLIHDGSMSLSGSGNKVKDLQKFYEKIDERIKNVIVGNSKITSEEYDNNADRELYLLAYECKEKGLCDFIIGEDCELEEIL
jgi:ATP-dependent Clp protease protease subunit